MVSIIEKNWMDQHSNLKGKMIHITTVTEDKIKNPTTLINEVPGQSEYEIKSYTEIRHMQPYQAASLNSELEHSIQPFIFWGVSTLHFQINN